MQSTDHPQDELLIIEALTQLGADLEDHNTARATRAKRLARDIAAEHGLDVGDALFQIDTNQSNLETSQYGQTDCPSQSTDED